MCVVLLIRQVHTFTPDLRDYNLIHINIKFKNMTFEMLTLQLNTYLGFKYKQLLLRKLFDLMQSLELNT